MSASVVKNGNDAGLGQLIINEVKKADNGGVLVEEAYLALTLDPLKNANGQVTQANITMGMVMDLLEWRISLYKAQAGSAPPNPQADRIASGFLSFGGWPAIANVAPQKDRAMKDVGDLACSQVNVLKLGNEPEVAEAAISSGNAIGAFGGHLSDQGLVNAAKPFKTISGTTTPDAYDKMCNDTKAAFKAAGVELSVP